MKTTRIAFAAMVVVALALSSSGQARADDDPWLGKDKALHFGVSAGIASVSYALVCPVLHDRPLSLGMAGGMAFGFGIAKEGYDLTGRGDPSWKDLTWDALGTVAGLAVGLAIDLLLMGTRSENGIADRANGN